MEDYVSYLQAGTPDRRRLFNILIIKISLKPIQSKVAQQQQQQQQNYNKPTSPYETTRHVSETSKGFLNATELIQLIFQLLLFYFKLTRLATTSNSKGSSVERKGLYFRYTADSFHEQCRRETETIGPRANSKRKLLFLRLNRTEGKKLLPSRKVIFFCAQTKSSSWLLNPTRKSIESTCVAFVTGYKWANQSFSVFLSKHTNDNFWRYKINTTISVYSCFIYEKLNKNQLILSNFWDKTNIL